MYIHVQSRPTFTDCAFTNCSANGLGGAVYCGPAGLARFTNCLFQHNDANELGGAVYHAPEAVSVFQSCQFVENTTDHLGGAMYYGRQCTVDVNDCQFSRSVANVSGGALYFDGACTGRIRHSVLTHNDANEAGGAFYAGGCKIEVADCNVAYNRARHGGGLYWHESPKSTILRCLIKHNEAVGLRVYLFQPNATDPNLLPKPILPGDAAYSLTSTALNHRKVRDPELEAQGGGVYCFAGPKCIEDCQIAYNTAVTSGGGVYLAAGEDDRRLLHNCLVAGNEAGRDGAGISNNWQSDVLIANCTIADNILCDLHTFGGGVYSSYESEAEVRDTIVWSNRGALGSQVAVASGDQNLSQPSHLKATYTDVDLTLDRAWEAMDCDTLPVIRSGFNQFSLAAGNNVSTALVDIGFQVNYFGKLTNQLYVNDNGNVTFDRALAFFTPFGLRGKIDTSIIAPFLADVDTRRPTPANDPNGYALVTYGPGTVGGRPAFGVNWVGVGYFNTHWDKRNSFQVVLINRSDRAAGDFNVEFNYGTIRWETGDASGGANGFGGYSARAGFSKGTGELGTFFEFEGSRTPGAFLDTSLATGLIHSSRKSHMPGRYVFAVKAGVVDVLTGKGMPVYVETGSTIDGWQPKDPSNPGDPSNSSGPWTSESETSPPTRTSSWVTISVKSTPGKR